MEVIEKIIQKSTQEESATKTFIINMAVSLLIVGVITSIASVATAAEPEEIDTEAETERCALLLSSRDGNNAQRTYCEEWLNENKADINIQNLTPGNQNKGSLSKGQQDRIINLAANVSNRMEASIKRLSNIAERLESRINKMKAEGKNIGEAEASLQQARLRISEAQLKIGGIDSDTYAFVTSEKPKETWLGLKETYKETREFISQAHKDLVTTVGHLKGNPVSTSQPEVVSCEVDTDCVFFLPDCEDCTVEAIPLSTQADRMTEKQTYCEANPPEAVCDLMITGTPKCVAGSCQIVEDNNQS